MEKMDISTILASAIHESKNHIGTLLYQLETLKRQPLKPDVELAIQKIEEGMKQLNDEWVEYLYLYRLASDGYHVHYDCFSLEEFLDDQVFALTQSALAKNLELSYDVDSDLTGVFDERLMTAVVSTAVYNALRYAKSKIALIATLEDNYLVIAIEDDGPGYNDHDYQEDELLFGSNTGLGLYFAELSANAHKIEEISGRIEKLKSSTLGGAKLAIYIPQ